MFVKFAAHSIDIDLSFVIKCYWLSNTAFLPYVIDNIKSQIGQRAINIYALYNTPIGQQPYRGVVDDIVENLGLDPDRIRLHTRDPDFQHPGVTKIPYHIWDELFRRDTLGPHLATMQRSSTDTTAKRFGALFGRIQLGRILLAHHLETVHAENSLVTFMAHKDQLAHEIFHMENAFQDIMTWWDLRHNPENTPPAHSHIGEYIQPYNIHTYPDVARQFHIEIVSETQYHYLGDFTEKIWRCLAFGKPFMLLSGAGSMQLLRDHGFRTFSPWIDESYDTMTQPMDRIRAIQKEIDRLDSLDCQAWNDTLAGLNAIADANAAHYAQWKPTVNLP
jgi:hypothetical protein